MKAKLYFLALGCFLIGKLTFASPDGHSVRILVVTGGHEYDKESFLEMMGSLGSGFTYEIAEFPGAFEMFLPRNRDKYDVLVFYHMWQTITPEQQKSMADCIREGKPLLVLHHSICAFDNWDEYSHICGGKYFHQPTEISGIKYPASSYIHDRHILVQVIDTLNPVTKNLRDFELFDETYQGFYVEPGVLPLLRTPDPTSTPVIGWQTQYGKSRVVTIQSGHDAPTYQNEIYRRLLRQAILWVYGKK
jgi:uncharacterized protein